MNTESHVFQDSDHKGSFTLSNGVGAYYTVKSVHHDKNQDCMGYFDVDGNLRIAVVSDGMGGHQAGDKASKAVVNAFKSKLAKLRPKTNIRNLVLDAIDLADKRVKNLKVGAGATLVAFSLDKDKIRFFNIGDSVGYIIGSRGKIKFRTIEHSPLGYGVESGLITLEEAEKGDVIDDHIVSNGVGFDNMRIEMTQSMSLSDGDIVLIMSDGLSKIFTQEVLVQWASSGAFDNRLESLYQNIQNDNEAYLQDDNTLIIFKYVDSSKKVNDAKSS